MGATMIKVSELFEVRYGVNLELNALELDPSGINFVSRTAQNNGVSARVKQLPDVAPITAGVITVAGGGSVMESFLQTEPFYSGRDLYYLIPRIPFDDAQKLYYCACIRANKYRYSYGRQANRTLREILIPLPADLPVWVNEANPNIYDGADKTYTPEPSPILAASDWQPFKLSNLFSLRKGKRLIKANMTIGNIPFIGSTDSKNGITAMIGQTLIHDGNTISVSYNGSVAEAFYQPSPFWATDDVNVLYQNFDMTPAIALFLCTVIRQEKYRFNYGRKWHLERMEQSVIKLPTAQAGQPDWDFMENYIKTLPFSSQLYPPPPPP